MEFTPKQIVNELDRFIIGQDEAKKRWQSLFAIVIEEVCFPRN